MCSQSPIYRQSRRFQTRHTTFTPTILLTSLFRLRSASEITIKFTAEKRKRKNSSELANETKMKLVQVSALNIRTVRAILQFSLLLSVIESNIGSLDAQSI